MARNGDGDCDGDLRWFGAGVSVGDVCDVGNAASGASADGGLPLPGVRWLGASCALGWVASYTLVKCSSETLV